ncbi:hypothetical protein ACDX78_04190 [Virgibacillus oceani]
MKHNKDDMQKELRELKTTSSLNPQQKESMKSAIRKHAKKKPKRKKLKQATIWASTAAVLFLAGILVFHMIENDQSVLPADDHEGSEHDEKTGDKEPADDENQEASNDETTNPKSFSVSEGETENGTIMIEGTEDEGIFTNFTLEPYDIHFQMEEFLGNYDVAEDSVTYYSDADNAWVRLKVAEDAALDAVVSDLQSQYSGDFSYTEEPSETSQEENPYEGIRQHFSDPPQGYYVYQIGENVLIIQYEYIITAGDGMGPRLQSLRESIK